MVFSCVVAEIIWQWSNNSTYIFGSGQYAEGYCIFFLRPLRNKCQMYYVFNVYTCLHAAFMPNKRAHTAFKSITGCIKDKV